jgi:hypothetical protein
MAFLNYFILKLVLVPVQCPNAERCAKGRGPIGSIVTTATISSGRRSAAGQPSEPDAECVIIMAGPILSSNLKAHLHPFSARF